MLQVEELSKSYGKFLAVDRLSFSVEDGAIFGFVGPNGAGKTTTMKILGTLLRPSSGKAWIAGEDVSQNPRRIRQLVGYMPDFWVYDDLKVDEYPFLQCQLPDSRPAERKNHLRFAGADGSGA